MNKLQISLMEKIIQISSVKDPFEGTGMTDDEVMQESNRYDKENYDPMEIIKHLQL